MEVYKNQAILLYTGFTDIGLCILLYRDDKVLTDPGNIESVPAAKAAVETFRPVVRLRFRIESVGARANLLHAPLFSAAAESLHNNMKIHESLLFITIR
jgi:hypothetical protein